MRCQAQDRTTGHALVLPELSAASGDQYLQAHNGTPNPSSDANAYQSRTGRAALRGEIPRTNRGQTIKKPDRLVAIRLLTCTYW